MAYNLKDNSHTQRVILLGLWALVTFWVRPWTGDLRGDPLTYACLAKDIAENNNWLAPVIEGNIYLNKPPLYFWLSALSLKAFGISFYAAKIPSLFFATVNVFLLYWIVYRLFKDQDMAFFTAFAFETTRWIFRNFATNRPESLLVFSILLGWYALILINEKRKSGPYLLGVSFAIGFMSKLFFSFFFPSVLFVYGLTTGRLRQWLKWSHFYYGCLFGLILSSLWFIYFEITHQGFLYYLIQEQTVQRVTEGAGSSKNPFMYLKELFLFYHPYLIFFIAGLFLLWKRRREEYFWLVLLAIVIIYLPLQLSVGKSDRYLTIITPFMSVATAIGIVRLEKVKKIAKGVAVYGVILLCIFFWVVPVTVHPEKYQVIHLAERLSKSGKVDYRDPLSFINITNDIRNRKVQFVEWEPFLPDREYRLVYYFYLSDSFEHWGNERLYKWMAERDNPIILLTSSNAVKRLPQDSVEWIEIDSDHYHALLVGVNNRPVLNSKGSINSLQ